MRKEQEAGGSLHCSPREAAGDLKVVVICSSGGLLSIFSPCVLQISYEPVVQEQNGEGEGRL